MFVYQVAFVFTLRNNENIMQNCFGLNKIIYHSRISSHQYIHILKEGAVNLIFKSIEDTYITKILTLSTGSPSPSSLTSSPNSISSSKPSSTNVTVSLIRTVMRYMKYHFIYKSLNSVPAL